MWTQSSSNALGMKRSGIAGNKSQLCTVKETNCSLTGAGNKMTSVATEVRIAVENTAKNKWLEIIVNDFEI